MNFSIVWYHFHSCRNLTILWLRIVLSILYFKLLISSFLFQAFEILAIRYLRLRTRLDITIQDFQKIEVIFW